MAFIKQFRVVVIWGVVIALSFSSGWAWAQNGEWSLDSLVSRLCLKKVTSENSNLYISEVAQLARRCEMADSLSSWLDLHRCSIKKLLLIGDLGQDQIKLGLGKPFRPVRSVQEKKSLGRYFSMYGYQLEKRQGDFYGAKKFYEKALAIFNELPSSDIRDQLAWIYHSLGNMYTRLGDYAKARIYLTKALNLTTTELPPGKEGVKVDMAILLRSEGHFEEAIKLSQDVLGSAQLDAETKWLAQLELIKNETAVGAYDLAEKRCDRLITELEGAKGKMLPEVLLAKADISAKKEDFKQALSLANQAIKKSGLISGSFNHRERAMAYLARGDYYLALEKNEDALGDYHKGLCQVIPQLAINDSLVLPRMSELYPENLIYYALVRKATAFGKIYEDTKDQQYWTLELESLELAQKASEILRSEFVFNSSKLLILNDSRRVSEMGIDAYWKLYQQNPKSAYLMNAFSFAESNKSVLLYEGLSQKELGYKDNVPDSIKSEIIELRGAIRELYYFESQLSHKEESTIAQNTKFLREQYIGQLKDLESKWRTAKDLEVYNLKGLQSLLPAKTAFFEYFYGEHDVYLFVVTSSRLSVFKLDKKALDQKIEQYNHFTMQAFSDQNTLDSFVQVSHELYELCLAPYLPKANRLILVPDGKLHLVAFDALVTHENDKGAYLIKDYSTLYAWSSKIYQYQKGKKPNDSNEVTAFYPVEFHRKNKEDLATLLYSPQEVQAISKHYKINAFSGEQATKKSFEQHWKKTSILHLSLHASGGIQPRLSFYDDDVLLPELDGFNQGLSMVVLSACESGEGQLDRAEGPLSLARGFTLMGAASVVQTQWKVEEQATAALMGRFYRYLAEGKAKDVALRLAKLDFLKTCSDNERIPYFWAGIIVSGSETPLLSNLHSINIGAYLGRLFVLFGLVVFWWIKRQKKS